MVERNDIPVNKHQRRTEATRARLLVAAERIFTRDGFERAQIEEIAKVAGNTRGAFYAHYRNKEALFLALLTDRKRMHEEKLTKLCAGLETVKERLAALERYYIQLLDNREWSLLHLEFKLFLLRHPESRAGLEKVYPLAPKPDDFLCQIYGRDGAERKDKVRRQQVESGLALLGAVMSAVVLEGQFEPKRLSRARSREALGRIFRALL